MGRFQVGQCDKSEIISESWNYPSSDYILLIFSSLSFLIVLRCLLEIFSVPTSNRQLEDLYDNLDWVGQMDSAERHHHNLTPNKRGSKETRKK